MQKKGCDASNLYDEEIGGSDQEFSDDEKERNHKKQKNLKKNKRKALGQLEEGEIMEDEAGEFGG